MKFGFLAVLQYPATDYATIYQSLVNFNHVINNLDQERLPVFADEKMYAIAREIQFQKQNEFVDLDVCLGNFRLTKIFCVCIGMFLEGSGARNIIAESGTFGIYVIDIVMNGTKYTKSVKRLMILCESLQRIKIMTFLIENKHYKRDESMINLIKNINSLISTNTQRMNECRCLDIRSLIDEFHHWTENCKASSKLFCSWNIYIDMTLLPANLISADRLGDFKVHLYFQFVEK